MKGNKVRLAFLAEGIYLFNAPRQSIILGTEPSRSGAFAVEDMTATPIGILFKSFKDAELELVPWTHVRSCKFVAEEAEKAPRSQK